MTCREFGIYTTNLKFDIAVHNPMDTLTVTLNVFGLCNIIFDKSQFSPNCTCAGPIVGQAGLWFCPSWPIGKYNLGVLPKLANQQIQSWGFAQVGQSCCREFSAGGGVLPTYRICCECTENVIRTSLLKWGHISRIFRHPSLGSYPPGRCTPNQKLHWRCCGSWPGGAHRRQKQRCKRHWVLPVMEYHLKVPTETSDVVPIESPNCNQ